MTPRFAKRAARMIALCKRLGLEPLDEARVQAAYERHIERRGLDVDYANCKSVTAVAQDLGMRRSVLFEWLDREGWMHHTSGGGWYATRDALSQGWAVQRGRGLVSWPQITPSGFREIAHRLGVSTDAGFAT